jgi:hypothetical protein
MELAMSKYLIALAAAASIAGSTSVVLAQDSQARDVAISKCVKQAQAQYPDDSITSQTSRAAVYKACMASGGYQP